ncbi:glycosyltransferase family protein [Acidithiobacillus caldus]|uniref:hypothetical protein n=1 Tax=Acidithiobacillus caldus TaxID=33059 RepID=UPI001C06DD91|nr:hypothetical protein [Acidithiobacillus caldus]MBU2763978.1 YfhO family protein [Acidithiobacillus caldus]MBU2770643.1 YfhO family protein [Acidithiobacillus caldus]
MTAAKQITNLFFYLIFCFLYILFSIIYFHPFAHNFKHTIFMPGGDRESFIWFINWWPYAILHGLNPFITSYVWAPSGDNLTWATSIPTLSLITAPLTIIFGPIFSWNLLSLLAAPLNAFCAFLLLKYLYKNNAAAFIGGYIFGFSSYVMGQLLGHLNLDFVCLIPLAVLYFIMHTKKEINKYYFTVIMSIIIFLEAGISTEVLATATLFGFISIILFLIFESRSRKKILISSLYLASSYFIAAILLSPFLYFLFKGFSGVPKIINSPITYSSDLLNYIIPTPVTRIGRSVFSSIASRFTGNYAEEGAYIGLPLLLLTAFSFRDYIADRKRVGLSLLAIFIIIIGFSLGPYLHVNGINTHIKMPWTFFTHVPLIRGALPTRFTDYASLMVAIIIGFWLSAEQSTKIRYVATIASILFILPNTSIYHWGGQNTPNIFTKYKALKGSNVLVLPFGYTGPSMFWQLESGMKFKMVGGYVGFTPLPFRRMQVTSELFSGAPDGGFNDLFKAYCSRFKVNYVVICRDTPVSLKTAIEHEGWRGKHYGQCTAYHVPSDMKYFGYSGNTWGSYNKFGWIGRSVTIETENEPIKITLTGQFIPHGAPNISVEVAEAHGKVIKKTFVPGSKHSVDININGINRIHISASNTWIPNNVIHNGDTRDLSVSMKIEKR